MVWDFDQTLIPGYMQSPFFAEYDIDPSQFWAEANALPDQYGKRDVRVTPSGNLPSHVYDSMWLRYAESAHLSLCLESASAR